jgi:hypothetical protein
MKDMLHFWYMMISTEGMEQSDEETPMTPRILKSTPSTPRDSVTPRLPSAPSTPRASAPQTPRRPSEPVVEVHCEAQEPFPGYKNLPTGNELYKCIFSYVLNQGELMANGFPRPHPSKDSGIVSHKTILLLLRYSVK